MRKRLVEVTWVDIETRPGWQDECKKDLRPIKTYGLLVRRGKVLTLASGYDPESKKWADLMRFPKGCVLSVRTVEEVSV